MAGLNDIRDDAKDLATTTEEGGLFALVVVGVLSSFVIWLVGLLVLRATHVDLLGWNAFWAVATLSFLGAIAIPSPGVTTIILFALRARPVALSFAVVGAAIGGTIGAALLLGLGHTGRRIMQKRATSNRFTRWALRWSHRLAQRWTYVGVTILLIPTIIPRIVVLAAASLAHLKGRPFLIAVFIGTLIREAIYAVVFVYSIRWF